MKMLYGTKIGMTRIYEGEAATAVTVIEVVPNEVVEVKTKEKHGYAAVKVACGKSKASCGSQPIAGEFKKAGVKPRLFLREIKGEIATAEAGAKITVESLDQKKLVDISGVTKGHGFQGAMKRHNFKGHKMTHGTQRHRAPGSIGCRMDPGKVHKNKKMPGHMGVDNVTIRNLRIVRVDAARNLLMVQGSIPGAVGGLVRLRQR